jgi:hypothetical protein
MWGLLPRKTQTLIVAGLAIILAWGLEGASQWATGQPLSMLKIISLVGTGVSIVLAAASAGWRHLWRRFPLLGRKIFPDLTGTWEGDLRSTWIEPSIGKPVLPISTTIWIRQGLFTTSIKLRTGESTSHSTRCLLEADPEAGRFRFWYSYDNTPKAEHRDRSARHEGVAWLELDIGSDRERLVGCYYTERKTIGDIEVRRVSKRVPLNSM